MNTPKKRIIIGVTGATGAIYTWRMLHMLRQLPEFETHLVISPAAVLTINHELNLAKHEFEQLADVVHPFKDIGASIASGSFRTHGMIIAPCSMKTLAATAHGLADNLITRAADVVLKERRRLILMVRETPFNLAHLKNMTAVTEMGGIIYPPLPTFYHHPDNINTLVDQSVERVLSMLDIDLPHALEWQGMSS